MNICYKNKYGEIKYTTVNWTFCNTTGDWRNAVLDNNILLTRSCILSLEEIPSDIKYVHPSLITYIRIVNSKKYVILHPRDFFNWNISDLENTFKGDFFSRWMQLSKRGILLGLPTAGAGGGTNDFILKNTQTQITFPLRDRIILGDDKSIEENSVIHEYLFDEYLMNFFKEYKQ